ncbi:unnamed protein product [Notodromas monacha]|uniref:Uncharacterized protein n=1 Tax=Notodromas monacha TaxID=399045 RepID=A0A7R9C1H9_9CRUS|nr:unnamed protein product [Notodromas monacha]CAG0924323.1 unnamed protein product [Notodromas monacha]
MEFGSQARGTFTCRAATMWFAPGRRLLACTAPKLAKR